MECSSYECVSARLLRACVRACVRVTRYVLMRVVAQLYFHSEIAHSWPKFWRHAKLRECRTDGEQKIRQASAKLGYEAAEVAGERLHKDFADVTAEYGRKASDKMGADVANRSE
eukprot:824611-Pleurochrysis_carterae.AAC.1